MDKKKQMLFNSNNFLLAVSDILDIRDIEQNGVTKSHSLRVAFLSLKIAQKESFNPKEMFDLCAYALFHNYIDNQRLKLLDIDNKDDKLSSIINYVHLIEEKYNFANEKISNRKMIISELQKGINSKYDKTFLEETKAVDFWLDCQNSNAMLHHIYATLHDFTTACDFEKVLEITKLFGSLYEDIDELLNIAKQICVYYKFEHKDTQMFLIACSMMNFGKLAISSRIIKKDSKLSEDEFELLKSNVYYLKQALQNIYGFDDIAKLATRHHEKLNGNGYPSAVSAKSLSLKDRLISIINIYNACLSTKTYRNKLNKEQTIKIIHKKALNNEIDKALVEDLEHLLR